MRQFPDPRSPHRTGGETPLSTPRWPMALMAALVVFSGATAAQDRHEHGPRGHRGEAAGVFFDQRHHHDHYYPSRGQLVPVLPGGAVALTFGGRPYHFHGGVWFSPRGGRFTVVMPPVGIVLPILPPAYVSLWIGGGRYFYANGVYYAPAMGGYAVVAPPPGADLAPAPPPVATPIAGAPAPAAPKPPPEPVIYPRSGQSAAQIEADRQECNRWATTQPAALADAEVFQRAIAACMDGRGYTVR